MKRIGFEKWWYEEGRYIDPDAEDVPWIDKRKALAEFAFEAGMKSAAISVNCTTKLSE